MNDYTKLMLTIRNFESKLGCNIEYVLINPHYFTPSIVAQADYLDYCRAHTPTPKFEPVDNVIDFEAYKLKRFGNSGYNPGGDSHA